MVYYKISATTIMVEEETFTTYGITCMNNGETIAKIDDVSTNKEDVESTIELFNKNQLDPEHFIEAVEDSLL